MNLTKGLLSIAGLIFLSSAYSINSFSNKELQIVATNYQLAYTIDIKDEKLFASGNITVKNISSSNANHIPLRLYRMLKVSQILNEKGKDLPFSQQILSNDNWPEMQTNYIEISLENQLKPNEYMTISIQYEGQLRGYAETGMLYVKDRISEDFSLIRRETKTYPIIGYPNYNVNSKVNVFLHLFDYQVSMTVPQGYVVANGGELIEKSSHKNQITYSYKNKMPAWRMDFAIAKYKVYSKDIYTIYSWENKKNVLRVLNEIVNTVDLYSNWFGPLAHKLGFTFIQVPENYGAQADVTAVIQDAVAFKGVENLDRVYHELSHQWNVKPLDQFSPRWNEGLATFLQALVLDKIHIPGHLDKETALTIKYLKKVFLKNPKYRTTPYIDYGKESLNSYSVGMIFFRLLFDVLGQKEFNSLTGSFYQKFQKQGATTQDFIDYFKMNSTKNINDVFEDWAYGTIYIEMLEKKASYAQILAHYKK